MSIRLGIIGAGGIAQFHAEASAAAGGCVVSVCDVEGERAAAFAERHGIERITTSSAEMLAADDLDAVVITAPNHLHHSLAIEAMRAGRDVLLEKPMACTVEACDAILATRDETQRMLQVGFVSRWAPAVRAVKQMIEAGRFGRIYAARAQWVRRRGIPGLGGWFTNKSLSGGGVLIDLGVHLVDLQLHLMGRPRPVRVSGACTSTFGSPIDTYRFDDMWAGPPRADGVFDVEDGATALIRLEEGATMELAVTWAANLPGDGLPNQIMLLGERGGCIFETWSNTVRVGIEQDGALVDLSPRVSFKDAWAEAFRLQHEQFASAVTSRTQPGASGEHGREVQAVLEAIYRSSELKSEVAVE